MTQGGLSTRGSCYGYGIASDVELNYLREGTGEVLRVVTGLPPDESVGELLRSWDPPDFPVRVRLYADGRGYRLWNEDAGWFMIDPDGGRIVVPPTGDPVRREERVWGLPTMLCFLARGDLALHASCVEIDGRAVVLAAPRRFGKTTLAAAFARAGYRILAEDLVCVRPGVSPEVIPGPAMLRIRRDMADHFSVPEAIELGRDEDRVHLALGQRGTCAALPLGAIVILLEGDTDPAMVPVQPALVVPDLWFLSFKLPADLDRQRCFDGVGRTAFSARTWNLTRRLRLADLDPTIDAIVRATSVAG